MKEAYRSAVRGCFVGVFIGDALGVPWELYEHEEILKLTDGKGVTGLQDLPPGHERKIAEMRDAPLGEISDDSEQTAMVAESLIRCGRFNLYDMALAHVGAFETSTKGWGGTTKEALTEIKRYFDTRGREGRRPDVPPAPKPNRGFGNGVVMKISPLACMHALSGGWGRKVSMTEPDEEPAAIRQMILDLGGMTHAIPDASRAALMVAETLRIALIRFPGMPVTPPSTKDILPYLSFKEFIDMPPVGRVFGDPARRDQILASADALRREAVGGFSADETAAFTVGTFLRHPTDFCAGVLETITAGKDTDTNAATVGAMIGANTGIEGIPKEWIRAVPKTAIAIDLADRMVETFFRA